MRRREWEVLRTCLAVEEALLGYQEAFGAAGTFQYECRKRMGRIYVKFSVPGERRDVLHRQGQSAIP